MDEYMAKAKSVQDAHFNEAGDLLARRYAEQSVVDVGLDLLTTGFLAVTSTALTPAQFGDTAKVTDIPYYGKLGQHFGGVHITSKNNAFSKGLAYNKHISELRATVRGLKLKNSAVHRHTTNRWMHTTFKQMVQDAIEVLHPDNSTSMVRIEVRSSTATTLGSDDWALSCKEKITAFANSLVAIDVVKVDAYDAAKEAFIAADAAGLFGRDNVLAAEDSIMSWRYWQGNRIMHKCGHNSKITDKKSIELEMSNSGWGNVFAPDAGDARSYTVEVPIGYTLAAGYKDPRVPAIGLQGDALAHAAHEAASSIIWHRATGECQYDCPIAVALQEIALYVRWRLIARSRTLTASRKAGGHAMKSFGSSLEEAALHILKNKLHLQTMVRYTA